MNRLKGKARHLKASTPRTQHVVMISSGGQIQRWVGSAPMKEVPSYVVMPGKPGRLVPERAKMNSRGMFRGIWS